jgi:uncharacterized protein YjiS (DUF1127 family)
MPVHEPQGDKTMAQIAQHHLATAAQRLANGIWNLVCTVVVTVPETLMTWQERAQTRATLRQIDARLLRDMGIDRTSAIHEANKPFWKA